MAYITRDQAVAVKGWKELTTALHRLGDKNEFGIEYELQRRLRLVGEGIAQAAPRFVTHKEGRPGREPLENSVRVSVTRNRASVFSTSEYGGLQNVGGGPKAGWSHRGPHVQRKNASKWMLRAVESQRENTKREMDGLLDWVVRELEIGI